MKMFCNIALTLLTFPLFCVNIVTCSKNGNTTDDFLHQGKSLMNETNNRIEETSTNAIDFRNETVVSEAILDVIPWTFISSYTKRHGCMLSMTTLDELDADGTLDDDQKVVYYITCNVVPGRVWKFDDFRDMTEVLPEDTHDVALDLRCNYEGKISLPWPMRAHRLRYLSVDRCRIHDFYEDYFNTGILDIPDTLKYFQFLDPALHITFDDMMKGLHIHNMTEASTCGPQNAYGWSMQNVSYVLPPPPVSSSAKSNETKRFETTVKSYYKNVTKDRIIQCNYDKLELYDRSRSKYLDSKEIVKMVQNGRYPVLSVFNLSRTSLLEIPDKLRDWRLHFPRLKYLDLRYNNISDFRMLVDHGRKTEDQSVGVIDLRNNNITTISYRTLRTLRHHIYVKVDIRDNPINCVCEMREFVNYLNKPHNNLTNDAHITGMKYVYLKDLRCANPPKVRGRRVVSLSVEELGCEKEIAMVEQGPIIVLSFILVLLILMVFLFIRYREEITILAFTRLNIILPCHVADNDEGKKYDAFVAYSQHDAAWVINILMKRLEKPENGAQFKLCLHHRDFEVGAAIFDNIMNSVKDSRHTILVLSRKFLQSEWCIMEFRTAFHQSLLERKKHLIIAIIEDIPEEEMDVDLKRCLKTLTYVHIGDNLFWDKLIFALSNKKRRTMKNNNQQYNEVV